jgi:CheY-like chemotaxis protein/anti-sigma regulatory factor (Ser/Thr protein kinase)
MSHTLLIAEDDENSRKVFRKVLAADGYHIIDVADGAAALDVLKNESIDVLLTDIFMPNMGGIELLERAREVQPNLRAIVMTGNNTKETVIDAMRNKACDFLSKPFHIDDLRAAVHAAMERNQECHIEIISAKPDWIELSVPCDLAAVEPIQKFLTELQPNLPSEAREAISSVFREMLNNAIEHGGKCDLSKRVEVKYIRLKRSILYSIKDPGEGFSLAEVEHAAFSNPDEDPLRHMEVRQRKGLRPGGYGIMLASQVMDELIYNEQHNELIFVKYLDNT